MPPSERPRSRAGGVPAAAGLCARCRHARATGNARGSTFVLCGRSTTDARFPRYPALPVVSCAGYAPTVDGSEESPHGP